MHKVKIINKGENLIPTHVYIDDEELKGITNVEYFNFGVDEPPTFRFTLRGNLGLVEINKANIEFSFTPETMQEAVTILRTALLTDKTFYDAFHASIHSQLKETPADIHPSDVARLVLDRVIGIERSV